jgi:hypothetical protein
LLFNITKTKTEWEQGCLHILKTSDYMVYDTSEHVIMCKYDIHIVLKHSKHRALYQNINVYNSSTVE